MTDKNLTEVAIILDRSGSMSTIRTDMQGGFKSFVADQRGLPGRCVFSLYQFDDSHETVYEERDINQIESLELVPRGSTALLDAMGRSIVRIGERLAKKPEAQRPGGVIVLVITDGQENASREFNADQIRAMVKRQETEWNWKFAFLGANIDAFATGSALWVGANANFTASPKGVQNMYIGTSNMLRNYRSAVQDEDVFAMAAVELNVEPDDSAKYP